MDRITFARWVIISAAVAWLTSPFISNAGRAQESSTAQAATVQTEWPGIYFEIAQAQRLPKNRLLVIVKIKASKETPATGVFIGKPGRPVPANATSYDLSSGRYNPVPFSLKGATMTSEQTGARYPVVPTVMPSGIASPNSESLAVMHPLQVDVLAIQFDIPPPLPPPAAGQPSPKQTLSFLLPKAKGAIEHVPLPPPDAKAP